MTVDSNSTAPGVLPQRGQSDGHFSKKSLNIVIVGGSLGGLFAGTALKSLGHATTILERNPTPLLQNQGAGIVAGGDTLAFFETYDRCGRALAVSSQKRMYLDKRGDVVHEVVMTQNMTSWDLAYYLLRANYDGVESEYCDVPAPREGDGTAEYRYGCTVTSLDDLGAGGVRVHYKTHDGGEERMTADLVVGADGPSSAVRKLFLPDVQRSLVGYCALRGTVPETEVSPKAQAAFCERFTFFHAPGTQILAYLIPGPNGSTERGKRLVNFVWYYNFPAEGQAFAELMTDDAGTRHRITLPPGSMRAHVWARQVAVADAVLPPQFAEIVRKTRFPFVQAVTDVVSPRNEFWDGRVVLIGDALAGFRPHTVASTSQAAFDAMVYADMVAGRVGREQWRLETMQFARLLQARGVEMGNRSQFGGDVPLEEHVKDRDVASTPRQKEVFPDWTKV